MFALAFSGCNYTWAVVWLSAAVAMNGSVSAGPLASIVDLSPNYASKLGFLFLQLLRDNLRRYSGYC